MNGLPLGVFWNIDIFFATGRNKPNKQLRTQMMKKGKVRLLAVLLLSIVYSIPTHAQNQNRKYFIINGKLITELANTDSCTVQIEKNNQRALLTPIAVHGRFRLELDYNSEYKLIFRKPGFLPKTIVIDTAIPENALCSSNFPHFLMAVKLSSDKANQDNLLAHNKVQRICYSIQNKEFARDSALPETELVDKGSNSAQSHVIRSQESKTKLEQYQVF